MTDLEVVPPEQCAAFADPFEETGRCREEGVHFHLGAFWCKVHLAEIKAAELRHHAKANAGLTRSVR